MVEGGDRHLVIEQALAAGEHPQDIVLALLQPHLVGRPLPHECILALLDVPLLELDHLLQQLVLEPLLGDREVDQLRLCRNLGRVVGHRQLRGHEEAERGVVLNRRGADVKVLSPSLPLDLLQQQRVQHRVQLLAHILQQHRDSGPDALGDALVVVRVHRPQRHQFAGLLQGLDPPIGLPLWVNHQRPPPGKGRDQRIVDGEVVGGKPLQLPFLDRHRVPHELGEGVGRGNGDSLGLAQACPILQALLPVVGREGAQVGDRARREEGVSEDGLGARVQLGGHLPVPDIFPGQQVHQLRRPEQLRLRQVIVGLQLGLLGHVLLQVLGQVCEAGVHSSKGGFCLRQLIHRLPELRLRLRQSLLLGLHNLVHPVELLKGDHPLAEADQGLAQILDLVRLERLVPDVLLHFLHCGLGHVLTVIV
mmetsp:Transcript_64913/g.115516  ORF Transcript_64913/g.115516 Transcript_64913/m.115516 type:complete len:420 (-) Transcript_64913:2945-4204(-)